MSKKVATAVLGANGVIMLAVGLLMVLSTEARLAEYALSKIQIGQVSPTFYGLGVSDGLGSIFSFLAMVLVHREYQSARAVALAVGAYYLLSGLVLLVLTGGLFALYFVASRGIIILGVSWRLPSPQPRAV